MQRILVVDDDASMREVIKDHLTPSYEVIDTGVPEAALAMTLEHKPDAILLDLNMPGLSGFELCQVLSSLSVTEQIPIFIVTGEDERNKAFCENLGALKYFTKPIDFKQLKTDLSWVLSSKKQDRREDPRIQLRVVIKLRGQDSAGNAFEVRAETENMSRGGFLCVCSQAMNMGTEAEAHLCGEAEYNLGRAKLIRVVESAVGKPRYAFQLLGSKAKAEPANADEKRRCG
jgi:DNA-binding response OmpR family regulator